LIGLKAAEQDADRQTEYTIQLPNATESLERLRIVREIPDRIFGKEDAQTKAADVLSALVDLIGQQVSHFAILQNRTKLEQKLGCLIRVPN
jgi:hypothetical protein